MGGCECRAEKVRGPEGPLEKPVQVAVKVMQPSQHPQGVDLLKVTAQDEANALEALRAKKLKAFTTPLHLLHLPPLSEPAAPAYIVMG